MGSPSDKLPTELRPQKPSPDIRIKFGKTLIEANGKAVWATVPFMMVIAVAVIATPTVILYLLNLILLAAKGASS